MKITFEKSMMWLIVIAAITTFIFLLKQCESIELPTQTTNKDSLNTIIASKESENDTLLKNNKALNVVIDSLKALKPKVIVRYRTVYDSLLVVDSACVRSLNLLYNECQKVDSVNNQIITNQETHIMDDSQIIGNMADIIALKQYQHVQDSLDKIALLEKLPLEFKRGKKQGRKQGILIGKAGEVTKDALYLYLKK